MGCVQAKPASSGSPSYSVDRLKSQHGYVSGGRPPRPPATGAEEKRDADTAPPPPRRIAGGEDELVGGWPVWLVSNIAEDVLAGLVPKSADSYVKIDKVSSMLFSWFNCSPNLERSSDLDGEN